MESSLEHSDEFFNNLLSFRSINQNECVHRQQEGSVVHNSHTPVHLDIVTGTRKPYMSKTITCQEMKKKKYYENRRSSGDAMCFELTDLQFSLPFA